MQGLKKDMEKLKKPEVKSFQSKYMQRKVNLRSAVNDKHQVKKNDMFQTELMKVPDIEEDDDEEDDDEEDNIIFRKLKIDPKKTDPKKKFFRDSFQLTDLVPKEKKDSLMLPVSESVIMEMSKEENARPEKPRINDY